MPVIFTATFPIRVNGNGVIDILDEFKKEVKECGCIDVSDVSKQLDTSLEQAQVIAKQLAGDGDIVCDPDTQYCCANDDRLAGFMDAMKRLRGDEVDTV